MHVEHIPMCVLFGVPLGRERGYVVRSTSSKFKEGEAAALYCGLEWNARF
jgi:hypothetical protein